MGRDVIIDGWPFIAALSFSVFVGLQRLRAIRPTGRVEGRRPRFPWYSDRIPFSRVLS